MIIMTSSFIIEHIITIPNTLVYENIDIVIEYDKHD